MEKIKKIEEYECILCGETFTGYGNNAQPLADGLCCDGCNLKVINARIRKCKMMKTLSDKINQDMRLRGIMNIGDVKQFIKDLKIEFNNGFYVGTREDLLEEAEEIINKLAGEKLI